MSKAITYRVGFWGDGKHYEELFDSREEAYAFFDTRIRNHVYYAITLSIISEIVLKESEQ